MTAVPIPDGGAEDEPCAEGNLRTVLVVGVDGSPPSWDAFSWVAGEAARANGRIVAVFVTPLVEVETAMAVTMPIDYGAAERARDETADELEVEIGKRAAELGVEVSFVRQYGDPAQALTRIARSAHADLIAVGRSAKMLHHLAGSLSRRLVLNRHLPVIVVVP